MSLKFLLIAVNYFIGISKNLIKLPNTSNNLFFVIFIYINNISKTMVILSD